MEIPATPAEDNMEDPLGLLRQRLQKASRTVRFARGKITNEFSREDITHVLDQGDAGLWKEVFSLYVLNLLKFGRVFTNNDFKQASASTEES